MEPALRILRPFFIIIAQEKETYEISLLSGIFISKNFDIHNNVVEAVTQYNDCKSHRSNNSFK